MRATVAFAAAALAPLAAAAGDKLSHAVIGWSAEGKYFAFERSGVQDGSGDPYCEVLIVDADAGELSAGPFKAQLERSVLSPEHACVAARNGAESALEKSGIDEAHSGIPLKITRASSAIAAGVRTRRMAFRTGPASCTLRLRETPAEPLAHDQPLVNWEVALRCGRKEEALHCSGCGRRMAAVARVTVQDVVAYRGRVAVFVELATYGFEGLDVTPVVFATRVSPAGR